MRQDVVALGQLGAELRGEANQPVLGGAGTLVESVQILGHAIRKNPNNNSDEKIIPRSQRRYRPDRIP